MIHIANTQGANMRHPAYLSDHNVAIIDRAFAAQPLGSSIIAIIEAVKTQVAMTIPACPGDTLDRRMAIARSWLAAYWQDARANYHW